MKNKHQFVNLLIFPANTRQFGDLYKRAGLYLGDSRIIRESLHRSCYHFQVIPANSHACWSKYLVLCLLSFHALLKAVTLCDAILENMFTCTNARKDKSHTI